MTQLVPNGKQQFSDQNGRPLVGGKVYFYSVGTSTPKNTYQDVAETILNTNPVIIDARGQASIYGTGRYRQVLRDSLGSTIWDQVITDPSDTLAGVLAGSGGASSVGWDRAALISDIANVHQMLDAQAANIWEFASLATNYTPGGDPSTWDWRPSIQAAVNTWKDVYFPQMAAPYRVNGQIDLNTNNCITMSSGVRIQQIGVNVTTFKAVQKDSVWLHCNGAMILGEGSWLNTWTGMGGHDDRGIQLWGCTNSGVTLPRISNCASAGIAIFGGSNILIDHPTIEGTHLYGHAIPLLGNFQAGIYIRDEATYGICDNLRIPGADISGVAQGVLSELYSAASVVSRAHSIPNANIHDIPGQHAFYIQGGAFNCDGAVLTNIALAGVKFQSADSNAAIRSFSALGITANGIGSNLFEMNNTGTGTVNGVLLSGTVDGCAVGLACNGTIRDLHADIIVTNCTSNAVLIQGNGAKDMDITVTAQSCGDEGVAIYATNATGISIRPKLRECNQNNGAGKAGIIVQSASAKVDLYDPEITDVSGKMAYGVFNTTLGSEVKIRGSIVVTGATDTAIRATGKITEFPTEAILQATNGPFTGLNNITSSQPMKVRATTNSASNAVLWQRTLETGKTYLVKALITGTLNGGTERRSTELFGCFYLAGGVATLQAAVTVVANAASGGFTGGLVLQGNGGDTVVLLVNSGGVATYGWTATVTVTEA